MNKDELTVKEAAGLLGVSPSSVKRYIRDGRLPSELRSRGRLQVRMIPKRAVETFNSKTDDPHCTPSDPVSSGNLGQEPDSTQVTSLVQVGSTGFDIEALRAALHPPALPEKQEAARQWFRFVGHILKWVNKMIRVPE